MNTDKIADLLTRIRNAVMAGHRFVEVPSSKLKVGIVKVLKENGFILNYKVVENKPQNILKIALRYHPQTKVPAIRALVRVSTPGLRKYSSVEDLPRILNGMGIVILSTPKGIISDKQARELNVGGEVLCYVY